LLKKLKRIEFESQRNFLKPNVRWKSNNRELLLISKGGKSKSS